MDWWAWLLLGMLIGNLWWLVPVCIALLVLIAVLIEANEKDAR